MKKIILIISLLICKETINAQQTEFLSRKFSGLTGPYLGQTPPGMKPELFAPEIIATGYNERDIAISPDGKEIFYGLLTTRHITIMRTNLMNGYWTEPQIASFAQKDQYYYLEPCFSADGKTLYFLSNCPPFGKEPKAGWFYQNIWASDKNPDGSWGEIYNPDTILNRQNTQFYPSLTKSGTIYFTRSDALSKKTVILRARKSGDKYLEPELLPPVINQSGNIFNAFVSPDESYLIACVGNKNNAVNPGFTNYCIFFRGKDDSWNEGIPFGPDINSKGSNAISASVSPDGKFIFFAAQKISNEMQEKSKRGTLSSMFGFLNSPQNGNYDIYWVSAKLIEELRPKE
jgi:hypothetical protein